MRDWKLLADALALRIPPEDLARIQPSLESLEAAFRPLTASLPFDTEPAVLFSCPPEAAK